MSFVNQLIQQCILACQQQLQQQGFQCKVHFELEGMVSLPSEKELDFATLDRQLCQLGIPAKIKNEYWPGQWEYVSDMAGQTPLEEAHYLGRAMTLLPKLMRQQGATEVFLDPVVWHGSRQRYAAGSDAIFADQTGSVHVPNAIQINISICDVNGVNLMPDSGVGEWLQYQLLQTSYACALLYLPEFDAFERLTLRTEYGLDTELSSPWELSGGYKGSIALYKEKGKHDQPMGLKTLLIGLDQQPIISEDNWRETCRVEHRLGATSKRYDPYINVLFVLLNALDAIAMWQGSQNNEEQQSSAVPPAFSARPLPESLDDKDGKPSAWLQFNQDDWFANSIDQYCQNLSVSDLLYSGLCDAPFDLTSEVASNATSNSPGNIIKHHVLKGYRPNILSQQHPTKKISKE